jgi:solute:Na+ symporter, SSS family
VNATWGCIFSAILIIFYTVKGGLKSVVAADVFHFCVLIIALPLVLIMGVYEIGGWEHMTRLVSVSVDKFPVQMGWTTLGVLFLSLFFGETLVPPYFQRLVIGKSNEVTAKGVFASSLLSIPFFAVVGLIGLIALELNPNLNPDMALNQVIMDLMPVGIRGLAMAGMLAVILSSADAFLNAAAISLAHDVIGYVKPNLKVSNQLFAYRTMTVVVGMCSIAFAIAIPNVLDILIYAYQSWTPIILVPLVAGIWGVKTSPEQFYVPAGVGLASVLIWQFTAQNSVDVSAEASMIGILANLLTFIYLAYRK